MKKEIFLALILLACAAITVKGEAPATSQPIALTIIWDVSPTMKSYWQNMAILSKQAILSLRPDDYLEVISSHHDAGRLRVAQFIKGASIDEAKSISIILEDVKCANFLDSDVFRAVGEDRCIGQVVQYQVAAFSKELQVAVSDRFIIYFDGVVGSAADGDSANSINAAEPVGMSI